MDLEHEFRDTEAVAWMSNSSGCTTSGEGDESATAGLR